MHARRRSALFRCVEGLMRGGRLWLSALGRSLPGETTDKHRIKAADRFVGNRAVHSSLTEIYAATARWLLRDARSVVLAVDWTGAGAKHCVLSAGICHQGRTLPILSRGYPKHLVNNQEIQEQFLAELAVIIPAQCTPIIVTDAGFLLRWFDAVRQHGWHFVGRVRARTRVCLKGTWHPLQTIHRLATRRAKSLGKCPLRRRNPQTHRLILAKEPRPLGRSRKTRSGSQGQSSDDKDFSRAAHEPWLLATSLSCNPNAVIRVYGLRTQIEQTFRDFKNRRYGWAFSDIRTNSSQRIDVLLLCASLANIGLRFIATAAELSSLERGFQANAIRKRRVISLFALARHVLRANIHIHPKLLTQAARSVASRLGDNSPLATKK